MSHIRVWLWMILGASGLILFFAGCRFGDDDDNSAGSDTDVDSDADSDSDSDAETDTDSATDTDDEDLVDCTECEAPTCLSSFTGQILKPDGTPVVGDNVARICMPNCTWITTDKDGRFTQPLPNDAGCKGYDFTEEATIDFTLAPVVDETNVHYAVAYTPSQAQVSDEGPDDFNFDVGVHIMYETFSETAKYSPQEGASVDLSGVSFDVEPGALGEEDLNIGVFELPLDEWTPPFIDNVFLESSVDRLDALYYLTPFFTPVVSGDGISVKIEPPDGWIESDTGKVYVLGDYLGGFIGLPDGTDAPIGQLVEWGPTGFEDGKIVTEPVPLFCWIGIRKD